MNMLLHGDGRRYAFEEDADESLWATRDYFWALKAGLIDGHDRPGWRSFRDGYSYHVPATPEPPHPDRLEVAV